VVQVFDSDVAKAVAHARQVGCHVVSMSLGGKGFFGLKGEIQRAVDAGMIGAAQKVEHYEIAVYGTLATFARKEQEEKQEVPTT
jgi:ferritin-like metal-binding protein YciE